LALGEGGDFHHKCVCEVLNRQFFVAAVLVAQINIVNLSKFFARFDFTIG